jgi:hypothetical protein
MKTIPLTQGKVTIVDDAVYDALMGYGWKWYASKSYARTNVNYCEDAKRKHTTVHLHRWILESFYNVRIGGCGIDHINGNGLDNRLENLRVATFSQNMHNRGAYSNNATGFKGVHCVGAFGKHSAQIQVNGKKVHLGLHTTPLDAAIAYDKAARELHGEFARTNARPLSELKDYLRSLEDETRARRVPSAMPPNR